MSVKKRRAIKKIIGTPPARSGCHISEANSGFLCPLALPSQLCPSAYPFPSHCFCPNPHLPPCPPSCCPCPFIRVTGPGDGGGADPEDPITGVGEPGCQAELYIDGVFVGRVPIDAQGRWMYTPPTPWPPGRHCVRAVLRCPNDPDPNPPEDTRCFDITPPACPPPVIESPALNAVISSSRPSIAGEGIPLSTVNVMLLDALGGQIFSLDTVVREDGGWGVQSPVTLPDGTYTVIATQLGGDFCVSTNASRSFSVFTVNTEALEINLVSLTRGQTFRTVDMVVTGSSTPDTAVTLYYLLLTPEQPIPTEEEVVNYNDAATLTTGHAVRGVFTRNLAAATQTFPFTLEGKENITPLPLETGVMDGFHYNVFLVGQTASGHTTGVLTLSQPAMGMPFASGNGVTGDPFFVRMCTPAEMAFYPDLTQGNPGNRAGVTENARILDNIEGMQVLYDETAGVHGLPDSLALSYRLDTAFDLSNYAGAWDGNGWRPIGNTDPELLAPPLSGPHIFTGVAETPPSGTAISGLRINATATPAEPVLVRGLFGHASNVSLARFVLSDPVVSALTTGLSDAAQIGKIGALVGYLQGGALTDISLGTVLVSAGRSGGGVNPVYAGGVAGLVQGSVTISGIAVTAANLTEAVPDTCRNGGLIGLLDQAGGLADLERLFVQTANIQGVRIQGGLIGESRGGIFRAAALTVNTANLSQVTDRSGGLIGLLDAGSATNLGGLTVEQIAVNTLALPAAAAHLGGLVGYTILRAPTVITVGRVNSGQIIGVNRLGGAFGTVELRSGDCTFSDIRCAATVSGRTATVGGLGGGFFILTASTPISILNCHTDGVTISTINTATSGTTGGFCGYMGFQGFAGPPTTPVVLVSDCTSAATVITSGQESGGFVGRCSGAQYLRCKATGSVQGARWLGGFHGNTDALIPLDPENPSLQFILCQARGNVTGSVTNPTGTDGTGGFSGNCAYGLIDRCFSTGAVTVTNETETGGLVGLCFNPTVIRDSYATGATISNESSVGGLLGHGRGSPVSRCYASGAVQGSRIVAGLVGALENVGASVGSLSGSIALNPSAAATDPDGVVHRVCGSLGAGSTLSQNFARSDMTLTSGGTPVVPVSNPNGLDGQDMAPSNLLATMTSLGWDTATIWDPATIGTLGRPTLRNNPET